MRLKVEKVNKKLRESTNRVISVKLKSRVSLAEITDAVYAMGRAVDIVLGMKRNKKQKGN